MSISSIEQISLGGKNWLSADSLLAFLAERGRLTLEQLRCRGLPIEDTEFLRGQSFEQEILKHAIQPPTQVS